MGVEAVAQSVEGVEAPYDLVENFVFRCEENGSGMEPPWEKTPFPSAEQYVVHMERVLRTLHEISAIALGLEDRHYFDSFYTRPNGNALRLAHYPPLPADANAGHVRYGEHTDYSGFTLLHQDPDDSAGAGGLQVQDPQSKQWIPVSPIADYGEAGFVVNIGDLWKRWTNDRWMSTNHRVMNPEKGSEAAKKSRFSVVFFTGPRADAMIDTLPGQGQSKHAPISAGEHLAQKLARSNV
uniref:Fe2OG dioxygenase domain-containing protein n=2 Tax=Lotharella globosa TaxID=91324 RepID=A0A7S4DZ72_9EUKA